MNSSDEPQLLKDSDSINFLKKYFSTTDSSNYKSSTIAYLAALDHLHEQFPELAKNIVQELRDQRSFLKLIASENYSSLTVQLAMGNLLTDKYCEGYPFHRFYAGCENVDFIESQAAELAKNLYGADHAYVQPHSGADANIVAFWAILNQRIQSKETALFGKKSIDELTAEEYEKVRLVLCKQKVLGLSLSSGGHLTHGYRHNVSAKMMQAISYDVNPDTGLIDYDQISKIAKKEKPLILLAGYSAYSRKINFAKMRQIADDVDAVLMVDMAHFSGLVAGKVFKGEYDPIPYAHVVTSTTHKTLRGPRGGFILCKQEFADAVNKGCPIFLGGPLPHVIAAKAIAFKEASSSEFQKYSQDVVNNADQLAQTLLSEGLHVLTGGTENHLMVIDVSSIGLTGRQAETLLREAGMTINRNMVPNDKNGAWYTSGIRLGTPAITTLGMGYAEMKEIGKNICKVLKNSKPIKMPESENLSKAKAFVSPTIINEVKNDMHSLLKRFPLYPELCID